MDQLISLWQGLGGRRQMIVGISAVVMFGSVILLSRMATTPTQALLYSGIDPGSAGEVVQALEQRGVSFEIRGSSIFVESALRDELRMTLASQGLPSLSGQGYELLDGLSGFGTTAQMFDVAYWRAKEGELARTITAGHLFSAARVHISNKSTSPFKRTETMTASVTANSTSGGLTSANAKGLRFLVASAVAGLTPDNVTVIDGRTGNVIAGDSETASSDNSQDIETRLRGNAERLLAARVGSGNAVVEVNVETVTESESISETLIDPDSRVAISSEVEERTNSSDDVRAGAVTVASNLPQGDASGSNNNSSSKNSETTQRTNFEVSETRREILRVPGKIKRVSTAVLINGISSPNPTTGEVEWRPRSEEELAVLEQLVKSAVGFDEARGDSITLQTLEFEASAPELVSPPVSFVQNLGLDVMRLAQVAILAVVSLVLGLFVLRPILIAGPNGPNQAKAILDDSGPMSLPTAADANRAPESQTALTGEIEDGPIPVIDLHRPISGSTGEIALPQTASPTADPVDRLRQMIEDRQEETVEILRTWIEDGEENVS
ncbi:MAG: flagellar basal-body MS-ring/collar protein FliF [Marinosulfonomonas sp.]